MRQLEQDADAASAAVVGGGTIPEGKALVWPRTEGFVAKARRVRVRARQQEQGETEEEEEQKVFLNVVVSERMPPPALGEGGRVWHCPNALGPARVEEDSGSCVVWVGRPTGGCRPSNCTLRCGRGEVVRPPNNTYPTHPHTQPATPRSPTTFSSTPRRPRTSGCGSR